MTGADILVEFNRQIFKAYSTFYNNTKMNGLLKKALVVSLEQQYEELSEQKNFDALSPVIKLNQVFKLNNNRINTAPLDIVNITHAADFTVTTRIKHNVKVGDLVTLANVAGFATSINGVQQVTLLQNDYSFEFAATFTAGSYTAGTGQITVHELNQVSKMVADYNHLLAVKAKFEQVLTYKVTDVTNTQPIKIVLDTINNNIVSREMVNVSGVLDNTNANGDKYFKKINRKTFGLYNDEDLSVSTTSNGSGAFQGLPKLKRIFYNYCVPTVSIEKINNYDDASMSKPKFEQGDMTIRIMPENVVCTEITMDYISNAVVFIDVADSNVDLLDTYNQEFLYLVISRAVQIFGAEVNDQQKYQTAAIEVKEEK